MRFLDRVTRWVTWGALGVVAVTGLTVIPGLTVIVALFVWFWWAQPLAGPLDELDAELIALLESH